MADIEKQEPGFEELGLIPPLLRALASLGYEEPTAVQRGAIPLLLEGRDLLGQAATGTGKTAAFALPLLQRLAGGEQTRSPRGLVLVPTRELAMQVAEAVHRYGRELGIRVLPIYGGQPITRQLRALERGIDVVVATPGRALDHISRGTLRLEQVQTVVLDEADEMLDMGFADDIESILAVTPKERQTLLFSATFPPRLDYIAKRHMRDARRLEIERDAPAKGDNPRIRQVAYVVPRAHKMTALARVLDVEAPTAAIVFCRTRTEVDELTETMNSRGYRAEALHGGMSQEQRDRVMGRLRAGSADLLIATDVAARGLDFEQLTHVVNYDVPSAPDAYVHRIGRVGRAGREGVALTLAEPREQRLLKNIERATGQRLQMQKVPTVADMRARRMELTRAALREALMDDGGSDTYRVIVESLADEFDIMDIAMAAVKLAHEATAPAEAEEKDVPEISMSQPRHNEGGGRIQGRPRESRGNTARIFVGAGRSLGIRPQDLVGAIANEAGLKGSDIGILQIADSHSIVEVPESVAQHVIAALRQTTIKGRKTNVRRYKDEG